MKDRIHPSWLTVGLIFVIMSTIYTIPYNTTQIFIDAISTDMDISRTACNMILTIRALASTSMVIFMGYFMKRFEIKKLIVFGVLAVSTALLASTMAKTIYQLYIIYFILGIATSFISDMVFSIFLNHWFSTKVSLANGIASMGSGLGGAVFAMIAGLLLVNNGWRFTFRVIVVISLVFALPAALLLKSFPSDIGMKPYGVSCDEEVRLWGVDFSEIKVSKHFWINLTCTCLLNYFNYVVFISLPDYLMNIGYPIDTAASVSAALLFIMSFMKISTGYIYDKFDIKNGILFSCLVLLIGMVSVNFAKIPIFLPLIALCFGMGSANIPLNLQAVCLQLYGNKDYATTYRVFTFVNTIGGIVMPLVAGMVFDLTGCYQSLYRFLIGPVIILITVFQINIRKVRGMVASIK